MVVWRSEPTIRTVAAAVEAVAARTIPESDAAAVDSIVASVATPAVAHYNHHNSLAVVAAEAVVVAPNNNDDFVEHEDRA